MPLPRNFFAPSFRRRLLGGYFAALVGIMVFLATFSAIAEAALSAATYTWNRGVTTRLTVEIPAVGDETSTPQAARVGQVLAVLRAMPDVASAAQVPDADVENLLKPWIDDASLLKALPVPALIDVVRKPGSLMTARDAQQQVRTVVADARVDDHAAWLGDLTKLVRGLTLLGVVIIALTAFALILTVSLVCRAAMAAERETVILLHTLGAEDDDIAGHFAWHARRLSLPAAAFGFAFAALGAGTMLYFLRHFINPAALSPAWVAGLAVAPLAVPAAAVVIASLSARHAVMNDLARMP